jgi:6,7-dimethyl-8-ribityllumazine synthase
MPNPSAQEVPPVPRSIEGRLDAAKKQFAIIVSRFNSLVTKELLDGAVDCLQRHGADTAKIDVVWVPGAFEIPLAAKALVKKGGYDAIIALGCVLKGATTHDQYIASEVSKGLAQVSLESGIPIGFGVLTPDTLEQALDRAGMKAGNKGAEAALSAIEMIQVLKQLQ